MPPRKQADRNYEDMVDENALHITPEQASTFGERREVLKESEANALRERAARADHLMVQLEDLKAQLQSHTSNLLVQDGSLMVQGFQFTPTGLITPESFSEESWQQIGLLLFKLEGSLQWLIGDWLVYGVDLHYGDIAQIAAALGRDSATLHNYASVSRNVEFSLRSENLSYNHHVLIAPLPSPRQLEALIYATEHHLSVAAFRQWLKGESPKLPAGGMAPDIVSISREIKHLMGQDLSHFKPQNKAALLAHLTQLRRLIDTIESKVIAED